jgi:hypothetical protein
MVGYRHKSVSRPAFALGRTRLGDKDNPRAGIARTKQILRALQVGGAERNSRLNDLTLMTKPLNDFEIVFDQASL